MNSLIIIYVIVLMIHVLPADKREIKSVYICMVPLRHSRMSHLPQQCGNF